MTGYLVFLARIYAYTLAVFADVHRISYSFLIIDWGIIAYLHGVNIFMSSMRMGPTYFSGGFWTN
jgi:hypothetical protein